MAAEAAKIAPLIVFNKTDLPESTSWLDKLELYQKLGYTLLKTSALENDISALLEALEGQCSILLGQSGMGKSTITNALLGEDRARTGILSEALHSGKHTTTHSQLYHLNTNSQLIDSPGLQEFGLKHIVPTDLIYYFPEMRPLIGKCRFHNCTHRQEPGCAIKEAEQDGLITSERLTFFQKLMDELLRK